MKPIIAPILLLATVVTLSAARPSSAAGRYIVTVDNGPHAGKYEAKASEIQCFHSKSQSVLAATFSNMDPRSDKAGVQSGIRVYNPDVAGAKTGELTVDFGTFIKHSTDYLITKIPVTMTVSGKGADIAGAGKTKDGVQIRVEVSCADVVQM